MVRGSGVNLMLRALYCLPILLVSAMPVAAEESDTDRLLGDGVCRECDLSEFALNGRKLPAAVNLQGSDLRGANLGSADLRNAILTGAQMQEVQADFATLEGADLSGARVEDANFSFAQLKGAKYQDVDLATANMCSAVMPFGDINYAACTKKK